MTIKQLADSLGISKNKLKYRIRNLPDEYFQKKGNITYVTSQGEAAIRELFTTTESVSNHHQPVLNQFKPVDDETKSHENQEEPIDDDKESVYKQMDKLIAILEKELEAKNKHIDESTAALHAAQGLHVGTIKTHLISQETEHTPPGFFSRLFGRQKTKPD